MKDRITPESHYVKRRKFLKLAAMLGIAAGSAAIPDLSWAKLKDELGDEATDYESITSYNNFYEFTTDKNGVVPLVKDFKVVPWEIEVTGLVSKPKKYNMEMISKLPQVSRVYRFRCVEAWSMVIPWNGIELKSLLEDVKPKSNAKYVRFVSALDRKAMPGISSGGLDFPYEEGLRLDEAMHPLALLATGIYSKPIPKQNGAPLRLVVPWKYGFKNIKSIVKIELTEKMPPTSWSKNNPKEYGFYANVNPDVDHPRWSQGSERRIGEFLRRKTLLFNGYEKEVASLYKGIDLNKNF